MKKFLKIAALVVSLCLIIGLLWFANGLVGNPISKHLAAKAAQQRLEESYGNTDFILEDVSYSFKDGSYYANVSSPSSIDSAFTMVFDWNGQLRWDGYEDRVLSKENTARRLDMEYRALTDRIFENPSFPYTCSIAYGTLESIPRENLELDKVYDISALGSENGHLVIYVDSDTITPEKAAEIMVKIRSIMDEAGIAFRAMDFHLQRPLPPEGPRPEEWIGSEDFLYGDIYEEGMVDRVKSADEALKAYYAEQDEKKNDLTQKETP